MIWSAHIAAGTVAALSSTRLARGRGARMAIACGLGLLSHVVLDAIPHADYALLPSAAFVPVALAEIVLISVIVAAILGRRLLLQHIDTVLAGVFGALVLDAKFVAAVLLPPDAALVVKQYGDGLHRYFHAGLPPSPRWGHAIQLGCTLMLLIVLARMARSARDDTRADLDPTSAVV